MTAIDSNLSRREMVIGATGALGATAGCLNHLRRTAERDDPTQVSVDILTLPDDEDKKSIRVANHLANNLESAGISVDVVPVRYDVFLRRVLINHDYDIYVWRHPPRSDPDYLRVLLHSRFAEEPGWQNPFSYSNSLLDSLLEDQRQQSGEERVETIKEIQRHIREERPFVPILFEQEYRLYRPEVLSIPRTPQAGDPAWLLGLRMDETAIESDPTCRLGTTDSRLTDNLNPIAVEYRGGNGVIKLIYDPAARKWGDELVPWAAQSWEWTSPSGASAPTLAMRMRDDLRWHDGEPVTADDIVFSYRFYTDTTKTEDDPTIPAPRFRARSSLIDTIEAIDDRTVRMQFVRSTRNIARNVMTLPILPKHVWGNHTHLTDIAGVTVAEGMTEALVIDNIEPVGSGPFEVSAAESGESLELTRAPDHFIWNEEFEHDIAQTIGAPNFERFILDIRPSAANIADSIRQANLDGTLRGLGRDVVEGNSGDASPSVEQTRQLFHVGFNLREFPFTVHGFRDAVARLIDSEYLLAEVFHGAGKPVRSPIFDDAWVPEELHWNRRDSSEFAGENGTGEADPETAQEHFRDAGFQYSADEQLLARQN